MKHLAAVLSIWITVAGAAAAASLVVDAGKTGPPFAPTMYGIFFEEINHAGDGGLYAEMVRNRGFEDYRPVEGSVWTNGSWQIPGHWRNRPDISNDRHVAWNLVNGSGSVARITLETDGGLSTNTPSCLKLEITEARGDGAGIANDGYWGMGVKAGEKYQLSFYAKGEYAGRLTAYLVDPTGKPVSDKVRFKSVPGTWNAFKGSFKAAVSEPKAKLVILGDAVGTVYFDMVSVFPQRTFRNRPNGLRQDIAQMLADLKPGFLRWPGGCIVEGLCLENGFNWKETIGPIEQRPGKYTLWGYRRTEGFGYHEFLQYCEDLGAEPLLVVNAGISCQWRSPSFAGLDQLQPYIQDTLDAIEYANGPASSKWGAVRAANGHRGPFKLKYLEIGNENWGGEYAERYIKIYEGVKQRYPEMIAIANNVLPGMKLDINDEHFYSNPEFFLANANKYDSYDRKAHKVFIGEVACTEGSGATGNLRAALGEAAFLLGAERNPDIVQLVSYAPLLVNANDRTWSPDAITLDTTRAFGNPSYYLYKMLGNNRPDVALPVELQAEPAAPVFPGKIGVGTLNTVSEFKDLRVEKGGQVLYQSDFSQGIAGWETQGGKCGAADGSLRADNVGKAVFGDYRWSDYTLTLKARKVSGKEGFLVYFSSEGRLNIGGWDNTQHALEIPGVKSQNKPGKIEEGRWYDVKVELKGGAVKAYLDGELLFEAARPPVGIFAAAGREKKSGEVILKVANPTAQPYALDVQLNGVRSAASAGWETVLTGQPWDENSFQEPTKVAPMTQKVTGLGQRFTRTFRPYSFTVLRLKAE